MNATYTVREQLDDLDRAELQTLAGLPTWQPRDVHTESLQMYGARVLQFLLAFSCTGPLSDDDLQLAEHVAIYAVASPDCSPLALQKISDCRHLIAAILRGRAQGTNIAALPSAHVDKPNLGPMATLQPRPSTQPPSGTHANARPNLIDSIRQTLVANGDLKPSTVDVGF